MKMLFSPDCSSPIIHNETPTISNKTLTKTNSHSRRIINRLNNFLFYILSHPVLCDHELVGEFLMVQEFDVSFHPILSF